MKFLDLVKQRYSCRNYQKKSVEQDTVILRYIRSYSIQSLNMAQTDAFRLS